MAKKKKPNTSTVRKDGASRLPKAPVMTKASRAREQDAQARILRYGEILGEHPAQGKTAVKVSSIEGSASSTIGMLMDELLTSLTPASEVRRTASGKRPRFSHTIAHATRAAVDRDPNANPLFLSLRLPSSDHRSHSKRKAAHKVTVQKPSAASPRQNRPNRSTEEGSRQQSTISAPGSSRALAESVDTAAAATHGPTRRTLTSSLNRRCCYRVTRCTSFLGRFRSSRPTAAAAVSREDARMLSLLSDDLQRLRQYYLASLVRHDPPIEGGALLHCVRHFPKIGMLVRVSQVSYPRRRRRADSSGDLRVGLSAGTQILICDAAVVVLETPLRVVVVPVRTTTAPTRRRRSLRASDNGVEGQRALNSTPPADDATSPSVCAESISVPKHFPGSSGQLSALLHLCVSHQNPFFRHGEDTHVFPLPNSNGVLYAECLEPGPLHLHVL